MFAARSAISASGAPSATPAAIAARALVRLCASAKGKWKRLAPGRGRDQRLGDAVGHARSRPPRRRRRGRSAAGAARRARCGSSSPGRRPGRPRRRRPGSAVEHLGLGRRDRLDRAEQLDVDRADVGDHRDFGLGDRRQLGDLAGAPHRHLEHQDLGVRRRLEHGQRQPDLGVEVLAVGVDPAGQQRPGDVLDRGLADRAGDPDDAGTELAPPGAGQRLQRGQRVVGGEDPARRRRGASSRCPAELRLAPGRRPRPRRRPRSPRRRTRRRRRARRAGRRRGRPRRSRRSRSSPGAGEPGPPSATISAPSAARDLAAASRFMPGRRGARAPRGRPRGRRRGSCARPRTPGPARGPCRRSPRCRPARRARSASAIAARRSGSTSTSRRRPRPRRGLRR